MRYKYYKPIPYCADCGGKCCKFMPGICLPKDIIRLFPCETITESIKKALDIKQFSVDWFEGRTMPKPFLRPSIKGSYHRHDPSWGGECTFLSTKGCILPWSYRPHGCKIALPVVGGKCRTHYKMNSKLVAAREWHKTGIDLMNI